MMKEPKEVTRTIYATYWDCGNPEHSHIQYNSAEECMLRQEASKIAYRKKLERITRNRKIFDLKDQGLSQSQIAQRVGISKSRVCNIINRV